MRYLYEIKITRITPTYEGAFHEHDGTEKQGPRLQFPLELCFFSPGDNTFLVSFKM